MGGCHLPLGTLPKSDDALNSGAAQVCPKCGMKMALDEELQRQRETAFWAPEDAPPYRVRVEDRAGHQDSTTVWQKHLAIADDRKRGKQVEARLNKQCAHPRSKMMLDIFAPMNNISDKHSITAHDIR